MTRTVYSIEQLLYQVPTNSIICFTIIFFIFFNLIESLNHVPTYFHLILFNNYIVVYFALRPRAPVARVYYVVPLAVAV